jgi:hypothetical protein
MVRVRVLLREVMDVLPRKLSRNRKASVKDKPSDTDPFSYENHSGSWSLWKSFKDEDGRRLVADRLGSNK